MFAGIFKNKKIIITGDSGFKGTWLSIWLKELGADVYGYSLPAENKMDNFNLCGLEGIINHKDGDIRNREDLSKFFQQVKPDFAFHLAAQPIVLDSIKDPYTTFSTNVMGTVNFFESVRNCSSIKVAINITSDKCYKNQNWLWSYRESDELGGTDPYSCSKSISELITESYIKSYFANRDFPFIATARAGNVLGAGDWANFRIVPDIFRSIIGKKTVKVRNPSYTRPWQHVLEPLSGYLTLAHHLFENGKEYQGAWNFGPRNDNCSVLDVVKKIKEFERGLDFILSTDKGENKEHSILGLDISKSKNLLNWYPLLSFHETIRFVHNGYMSDLNGGLAINNRKEMISRYCRIGREKQIKWSN
tara:strand:+ start:704 stop:1786 length:1083 start_codon:yes stop_codon:yes gene_type:complete